MSNVDNYTRNSDQSVSGAVYDEKSQTKNDNENMQHYFCKLTRQKRITILSLSARLVKSPVYLCSKKQTRCNLRQDKRSFYFADILLDF